MFQAIPDKFLVTPNLSADELPHFPTTDRLTEASDWSNKRLKSELRERVVSITELQRRLYADNRHALLLVFQALDAGGKDSTIRHVLSGVNPAGCQVFAFKQPSKEELDHDFLWRTTRRLPERGRIGVFNRSYYEEVLVVRVHPHLLQYQNLPDVPALDQLWRERFESINELEHHVARNGTVIVKFWLNVSKKEQKKRFMARLDEPSKHWKFAPSDVAERRHWDDYQHAYRELLAATSKPHAPWYAIPADNKRYMRWHVATIIEKTLASLDLEYPTVSKKQRAEHEEMRAELEADSS